MILKTWFWFGSDCGEEEEMVVVNAAFAAVAAMFLLRWDKEFQNAGPKKFLLFILLLS